MLSEFIESLELSEGVKIISIENYSGEKESYMFKILFDVKDRKSELHKILQEEKRKQDPIIIA